MKKLIFSAFIFLFIFIFSLEAQSSQGALQVVCPAGFKLHLDGKYLGITNSEMGGYFVDNLRPGTYLVVMKQDGYKDISINVEIPKNGTKVVQIVPEQTGYKVERLQEEAVGVASKKGTIVLRSLPVGISVAVDGKTVGDTDLRLSEFPAGSHRIVFKRDQSTLAKDVILADGDTLNIKANFISKEISVISEREAAALEQAEKLALESRRIDLYLATDAKERCSLLLDGNEVANLDLSSVKTDGRQPTLTIHDVDYGDHELRIVIDSKYHSEQTYQCTVTRTNAGRVMASIMRNPSSGIVFFVFDRLPSSGDFKRWLGRTVSCTVSERSIIGTTETKKADIHLAANLKEFDLTTVSKTIWVGNAGFGPYSLTAKTLTLTDTEFRKSLASNLVIFDPRMANHDSLEKPLYSDLPNSFLLMDIFKRYSVRLKAWGDRGDVVRVINAWPAEKSWVITTRSVDYYEGMKNIGRYYTTTIPLFRYPSSPIELEPGINEIHLGIELNPGGDFFDIVVDNIVHR